MSFTTTIKFFQHLEAVVYAALVKVFGSDALTAAENDVKTILRADTYQFFVDAVNLAETLPQGTDKRAAAYAQITADLAKEGIQMEKSLVNLGIELVVDLLKRKTPPAPAK